jgi:isopenicillin N synthase-like dioxygenase
LGRLLHRAFSVDLGLKEDFFEDKLVHPAAVLRMLHYPPAPDTWEEGQQGCGVHTDYGNCTLLLPDATGGLEVQSRDGSWISPPPIPGTLIVNIGDLLMRWSNDVYVSTPHQVVHRSKTDRYSIAFFFEPEPLAEVKCLVTCKQNNDGAQCRSGAQGNKKLPAQAKYPTVKAFEHILMKLDASYKPASLSCGGEEEIATPTAPDNKNISRINDGADVTAASDGH